jgi:hypothetical protein
MLGLTKLRQPATRARYADINLPRFLEVNWGDFYQAGVSHIYIKNRKSDPSNPQSNTTLIASNPACIKCAGRRKRGNEFNKEDKYVK